jgi:hypothetical protein
VLWERFRAACDAVFSTRDNQRKEAEHRKHEHRRVFENLCEQLEQLALATDKDDAEVRRLQRELQQQWKTENAGPAPAPAAIETRFRNARAAVEKMLTGLVRAREAAVWQALLGKERLCEELDAIVIANRETEQATIGAAAAAAEAIRERWDAAPPLAGAWEKQMLARRDAALHALTDEDERYDYVERVEKEAEARREALVELELMLGIETPADLRAQRLAVQVKQLRDRFKSSPATGTGAAEEILLAWCTRPGVSDARDLQRCERIVATLERRR